MPELPIYHHGEVVATAILDEEDWLRLSRWHWFLNAKTGTARRVGRGPRGKTTNLQLHREVVGARPLDGTTVQRINGDKWDLRRANLRVVRTSHRT